MSKLSYLCPYCFTEHKIYDVEFRCKNLRCKPKPDLLQGSYYGKSPELRPICFPAPKESSYYMPEIGICPECHEQTATRVCPSCHNTLPATIDINNEMIISIIGSRDSGKSSYMGVLIHELKQRIAIGLNGAANFMDKDSSSEYERRFGQYLYPTTPGTTPRRIPQTKMNLVGKSVVGANRPILCDFKLEKKSFFNQITIPYTLVFFDTAGEVFDDEEAMFTIAKYIGKSQGIIFLLDPFQIPKVRGSLSSAVVYGASNVKAGTVSPAAEIVLRVANLIRAQNSISEKKKITIPVVAAFSKLDAIKEILPPGSWLLRESQHLESNSYVEQDGWNVKEEMLGLLHEWGEQEFLKHLELNYSKFQLGAFSALGNNPDVKGRIQAPRPHRIEDALLWILKEQEIIDSNVPKGRK